MPSFDLCGSAREAHGGNVWQSGAPGDYVDFSANIRPEGAPEWVVAALLRALDDVRYYPDLQMQAPRAALAAYAGLPVECALPTAGGMAAIELCARLAVGRAVVLEPAFAEYARCAHAQGRAVFSAPMLGPDHRVVAPFDALSGMLQPEDQVFVCNPVNPVGCAFDRGEMAKLLQAVERAGAALVVDEAFIDFCPECSIRHMAPDHPALMVTGSLTKCLGIPGARLGYLLAHPDVVARAERLASPWGLNAFAASVLCALPDHLGELHRDALDNAARRDRMAEALRALGAQVYPSRANFLLCDFGHPMGAIAARLRRERVLVRECGNFGGLDDAHIRLAVKTDEQNRALVDRLGQLLERLDG